MTSRSLNIMLVDDLKSDFIESMNKYNEVTREIVNDLIETINKEKYSKVPYAVMISALLVVTSGVMNRVFAECITSKKEGVAFMECWKSSNIATEAVKSLLEDMVEMGRDGILSAIAKNVDKEVLEEYMMKTMEKFGKN